MTTNKYYALEELASMEFANLQHSNSQLANCKQRRLTDDEAVLFKTFDDDYYFYGDTPDDHRPTQLPLEVVEQAVQNDFVQAIIGPKDQLIAALWLDLQAQNLYFADIVAHPNWRRKGIASHLLGLALKFADSQKLSTINLEVDPLNSVAINMYFKAGFLITGYKNESNAQFEEYGWVGMTKFLTDPPKLDKAKVQTITAGNDQAIESAVTKGLLGFAINGKATGQASKQNQLLFVPQI